eukprot:NODE_2545_length_774_cov_63.651034_g1776_i0.p1 GENE.NODE_2545_length_774_cov_63.651034_g1776_i0~~NODE_2545_length_774_cov_63.651034_g1776_i0.p1  ORF type:complete len:91 (+),score=2.03 NODE_2545_length_774_cov_63.651034_g1776_i0:29-274(+)
MGGRAGQWGPPIGTGTGRLACVYGGLWWHVSECGNLAHLSTPPTCNLPHLYPPWPAKQLEHIESSPGEAVFFPMALTPPLL